MAVATFTKEEQQLIDGLRDKYSNFKGGVPTDPNAAEAVNYQPQQLGQYSGRSGKGSDVTASLCPQCQGTGSIIEIYNHRRLEKFCVDCEGRGCKLSKNGQDINPSATSERSVVAVSTSTDKPAWALEVKERIARMSGDIQKIDAKLTQYAKEREEVTCSSGVGDTVHAELAAGVVAALDAQVVKLKALRASKEAALHRLRNPATIDDIIANESPSLTAAH